MRLVPLAALALASWSATAEASTFRQISLSELVNTSAAVVQVEVLSTRSAWTAGEHPDVRTWADVRVVRSLDGALNVGDTLTVVEVGGTVDDYTMQAVAFPQLVAGAELVVFLTHWKDATKDWRVAGYGQGFYEVVREGGVEKLYPGLVQGSAPRSTEVTIDTVVPPGTRVDDLEHAVRSVRH